MKSKLFLVLLCFICLISSGCVNEEVGDISNVKTTIINENEHSKKDIERTFEIIKREFKTSGFKDCELISIEYDGTNDDKERELLVAESNADEAIVLSFTFKTGNNPEQVFNSNSEYTYTADFIKAEMGWKKINWGQG